MRASMVTTKATGASKNRKLRSNCACRAARSSRSAPNAPYSAWLAARAGSDWPVVMRRAEVSAEWNRLHRLGDGWPTVDRDALLGGTATRVYGIAA